MWFMLLAALVGVVVGVLRGGRLRRIGDAPFRGWALLVAGVAVQVVAGWFPDAAGTVAVVASFGALMVFAVWNLRIAGMALVAIGIAMNAATIAANGGMPVREEAAVAAGIASFGELEDFDFGPKRHLARDDDALMVLSDIIPVRPTREVLSFGDLVMSFGVADVVYHLMRRRPRPGVPRPVEEVAALSCAGGRPSSPGGG